VIAARERRKHEPPVAFWDRLHLDVAIAGDREIWAMISFSWALRLESVAVSGAPVTLHAVVVEQPLRPGASRIVHPTRPTVFLQRR
jgi:hypothetical protein